MIKINLRSVLKDKDITLSQLHKETGISLRGLSALQNQKNDGIQFSTISKICNALDINIEDLMSYEEQFNISVHIEPLEDLDFIYECCFKITLEGKNHIISFKLIKASLFLYEVDYIDFAKLPGDLQELFMYKNHRNNYSSIYKDLEIYEVLSYLITDQLISEVYNSSDEINNIFTLRSIMIDFGKVIPRYVEIKTKYDITMYEEFEYTFFYPKRFYEVPMSLNNQVPYNQLLSNRIVDRIIINEDKIEYIELIKRRTIRKK